MGTLLMLISHRKRLAVILGVGLTLTLGALFYTRYFLARPMGSGPAGPAVDRSAFAQPWTERPVRLIGIGDSIIAGLGASTPDRTCFNRLVQNPHDEYRDMQGICLSRVLPQLEHENLAVSGTTSIAHLSVINERLAPQADEVFGLIVMTTGGNDLIHSYGRAAPREGAMYGATLEQARPWIAAFRARLDEMLDSIDRCFPGGCEIYLGDIYDPTDGIGDAPSVFLPDWPDGLAIHAEYNQAIRQCAASRPNVHTVPLHATFLGHGSHCRQFWRTTYVREDPHYWFWDNVEDPNDRGHDAIRREFLIAIAKNTALLQKD